MTSFQSDDIEALRTSASSIVAKLKDPPYNTEGLSALAVIVDVMSKSLPNRVRTCLNHKKINIDLNLNTKTLVKHLGNKLFIKKLIEDKTILKDIFHINDLRFGENFQSALELSQANGAHVNIINPPLGEKPGDNKWMYYIGDSSSRIIDTIWAIQCAYIKACGYKIRRCRLIPRPGNYHDAMTVYYSRYFFNEESLGPYMEQDKLFLEKELSKKEPGDSPTKAFLPEDMNGSPNVCNIREDLLNSSCILSANTFSFPNRLTFTVWNLNKSSISDLSKAGHSKNRVLKVVCAILILLSIILVFILPFWFCIIPLALSLSYPISRHRRKKDKGYVSHYLAISKIQNIPNNDKDAGKITAMLERMNAAALSKNTASSRNSDNYNEKRGEEVLSRGYNKLAGNCEVSFYISDYRIRNSFCAYTHQLDTDNMERLSSLVSIVKPEEDNDATSKSPMIGELSDSYLSCESSMLKINSRSQEGHVYRFDEGTILYDHSNGNLCRVDYLGCRVSKTKFYSTMVAFKQKSTSKGSLRQDYLLMMLASDFVHEQLMDIKPFSYDSFYNIEIPVPVIIVQDGELALDRKKKEEEIIHQHKHSVNGCLNNVYNALDLIEKAMNDNGGILHENQIANTKNGATVKKLFGEIDGRLDEIGNLMKHFWEEDDMQPESLVHLRQFVKDYIAKRHSDVFHIEIDDSSLSDTEYLVNFPSDQLKIVMDNIINNANLHGFVSKEKSLYTIRIKIEGRSDDKEVILCISNNGERLPEGLTPSSVLKNGVGEGDSEHIGLGHISDICKKYSSRFEFNDNDSPDGFCIENKIIIPIYDRR